MSELFTIPDHPKPAPAQPPTDAEAAWRARHGIIIQTVHDPFGAGDIFIGSIEGKTLYRTGDTEAEALDRLCRAHGIERMNAASELRPPGQKP